MRTLALRSLLFTELFGVALCDSFGENIYVSERMTWSDAREYRQGDKENTDDQHCVAQSDEHWEAVSCEEKFPFYCFHSSLVLVKENKTGKEALEHCHRLDKELVSLTSESALTKSLGLRYLSDSWLWVDGTSTKNQTWSQEQIPQCPTWSHHCGVLFQEGQQLESWDCADKLNFMCYANGTS
uniref:C-type lectin domain-containing protein n=1 Tax=Xiphophorus couchianus TaxID=32473 RepID=A0A3B5MA85_9TELE